MKKILGVLLLIFGLFLVSACDDNKPDPNGNGKKPGEKVDEYWDKDGNGIPDWQEEEGIELTYATWQYTHDDMVTIDVMMIEAFMDKYPNITVKMEVVGEDYEWDENFFQRLEANNLPDVFLIRRLESFLPYNILADLTEMYDNDSDTQYIFPSVKNLGTFGGKRYAVPTFIYPKPWYVNLDLLDNAQVPTPKYDWTYEQMINIAKTVTKQSPSNPIFGMSAYSYFTHEYPKVLKIKENSAVGKDWYAFTFDGEKFNFNDPSMQQATNQMVDTINQGFNKPSFSEAELEERYNRVDFAPTYGGKVALWTEATWSIKNHFDEMNFNWDVYPGPNGVTGGNTDIAGVSSLSKHKQAAYQLLKWMSFDEEGLLTRFDIYENYGEELYKQANNFPYPIVDYGIDGQGVNKVWTKIPYGSVAPGFVSPEFLEGLRNGAFWANKETIGWDAVDYAISPYFNDILYGENDFASLKDVIIADSNQAFRDAIKAMREQLGLD